MYFVGISIFLNSYDGNATVMDVPCVVGRGFNVMFKDSPCCLSPDYICILLHSCVRHTARQTRCPAETKTDTD